MSQPRTETVHGAAVIKAPLERVWALSTRVELVRQTLGMNIVGGIRSGHVGPGSRVAWKGWKFGLPTEHHTLITGYAAPRPAQTIAGHGPELHAEVPGQLAAWFQDTQEKGRFALFHHDHWLRQRTEANGGVSTILEDEVHFALPFGPLGDLVARSVMVPYVRRLVKRRFASLKTLAEGEGWKQWV